MTVMIVRRSVDMSTRRCPRRYSWGRPNPPQNHNIIPVVTSEVTVAQTT